MSLFLIFYKDVAIRLCPPAQLYVVTQAMAPQYLRELRHTTVEWNKGEIQFKPQIFLQSVAKKECQNLEISFLH